MNVMEKYYVIDIQLADWASVVIARKGSDKVICNFNTDNGFDSSVELANRITDFLNQEQ